MAKYVWLGNPVAADFTDEFNANERWSLNGAAAISSGSLYLNPLGIADYAGHALLWPGNNVTVEMLGARLRVNNGRLWELTLRTTIGGQTFGIGLFQPQIGNIIGCEAFFVPSGGNKQSLASTALDTFTASSTYSNPWDIRIVLNASQVLYQAKRTGTGSWSTLHTQSIVPGPAFDFIAIRLANEQLGGASGQPQHQVDRLAVTNVQTATSPVAALVANGAVSAGGSAEKLPAQLVSGAGGISSAASLGTPRMRLTVKAETIVTETVIGAPRVGKIGYLNPDTIAPATRFGTPIIGLYKQFIHAPSIEPQTTFGTAFMNVEQEVKPSSIAAQTSLGAPRVIRAESAPLIIPSRTAVRWRIVLADRQGTKLVDVTSDALDVKFSWRLNRPETCTFRLPADNPLLRIVHTDGLPYLWPIVRWVYAYREERISPSNPALTNRLRFMGIVWQMQDQAGADGAVSTVVSAFGAMQLLTRRLCIDNQASPVRNPQNGNPPGPVFNNAQPSGALLTVINNSKQRRGDLPIDVTITESTSTFPVLDWQQKTIYDAMVEVAGMYDGLDYKWIYREDGRVNLEMRRRVGRDRPNAIFSWGPMGNCSQVTRLVDAQTFATSVIVIGSNLLSNGSPFAVGPRNDPEIARYGMFEVLSNYPDVTGSFIASQPTTWRILESLGVEELAFRSQLRQIISWKPQAGRAPEPWIDYEVGDTIRAYANELLRGGFGGVQRVYGIDVSINEQGTEDVAVLTSQE